VKKLTTFEQNKTMKLLISLILLLPLVAFAQQSTISGYITTKSKSPIRNANIFIEGSYDGATSDSIGYFQFTTTEIGLVAVKVTAIGYTAQTVNITLKDRLTLNFSLGTQREIDEVVVQAGQFRVGNLSKSVLSPLDIVTTAGSNGNIVAALEKLPGAQIAGENGRLMVRGGDAHETQTYINGIRVAQPYTSSANGVPVRGRFSPYLFKGTNFSTGGYSAEYGNALSSILNLTTAMEIDPQKTEISLSNVALGLSNTQNWNNTSLSFNTGYTNLKPYTNVIPQRITWTKPYEQFSGEAILKNKGKNHFFNLYGSYAFEKMGIKDYDIDYDSIVSTKINSNNVYINTNYIQYLPNNWKWETGGSYGYASKGTQYHLYTIPSTENHVHVKSKANKRVNARIQYTVGAEYFYDQFAEQIHTADTYNYADGYTQNTAGVFALTNWRLWDNLFLEGGLRYNTDFHTNKSLDPRFSLTYQINPNNQASFAYGTFHQNVPEAILKHTDSLSWAQAQHYILNYSYAAFGRQLRVELFHKKYDNLATYTTITPAFNSNYSTDGDGYAQGLDIFWKDDKSLRNLQYWVSYSWTDVHKKEQNYPTAVQPSYVAKHYASLVLKYWISSWRSQIGLTNTFSSGRPYNNPNDKIFMSARTNSRNDLSVNWSYLLTQQKIIHFSVTNILGQTHTYGYRYRRTADSQGIFASQPILPTAKRFVFVGFFWTISKNKKENNLDNL